MPAKTKIEVTKDTHRKLKRLKPDGVTWDFYLDRAGDVLGNATVVG